MAKQTRAVQAQRQLSPVKARDTGWDEVRETGWDDVAEWYLGWVGKEGGRHHRHVTIPAVLDVLAPRRGEHILDVGAGPGVLAPHIAAAGARYTGVDVSPRLLAFAREHHGQHGRFLQADARALSATPEIKRGSFDAAVFLLSIQDMDPLADVLRSVAWALRDGGRIVMLMTHPCFRVPRLSGWGWDEGRRLQYRRVDRYLTPLPVPMPTVGRRDGGATTRFHRPLEAYVNGLAARGFAVDCLREIPTHLARPPGPRAAEETRALREVPMFLAVRARHAPPTHGNLG